MSQASGRKIFAMRSLERPPIKQAKPNSLHPMSLDRRLTGLGTFFVLIGGLLQWCLLKRIEFD
ncbi:MAG: hypothetical protein JSR31_10580 [Nitrospira sp.]|nr:hypothetical protein [Nitrospira sp.]